MDFLLELKESNIILYYKILQKLYKTIKEIDSNALIVCYQPEEEEEDIIERNRAGVGIMVKNGLINFSKAMLNYL